MPKVISRRITLPEELDTWAGNIVDNNKISGIRSLSGLCERALDDLRKKLEVRNK